MLIPKKIYANFPVDIKIPEGPYLEMDGWLVSVYLRGPAEVTVDGVLDDSYYLLSVTATVPGLYTYSIVAENGTSRVLIETGQVNCLPDPTAITTGTDNRQYAEKALAAIEAVLLNRATADQQSYSIAGRSITKIPIVELMELREKFKKEVAAKRNQRPRVELARFGR